MRPSNSSSTVPVAEWITPRLLDRDPYGVLGQLRESAPVHWVPAIDRYVITRFDDCRYVETHPEVFTAEQPGHRVDRTIGRSMIRKDDPAHARERHAANHSLRVKAIADKWRPVFETNTDRLITEFIDRGSGADLSRDLAAPLAATNVAALVGLSHIPHEDVTRWSAAFMAGAANLAEEPDIWARVAAVNAEIDDAVDEATPHLRRHPDGSILSAMIEADMPVETQRANVSTLRVPGVGHLRRHQRTQACADQRGLGTVYAHRTTASGDGRAVAVRVGLRRDRAVASSGRSDLSPDDPRCRVGRMDHSCGRPSRSVVTCREPRSPTLREPRRIRCLSRIHRTPCVRRRSAYVRWPMGGSVLGGAGRPAHVVLPIAGTDRQRPCWSTLFRLDLPRDRKPSGAVGFRHSVSIENVHVSPRGRCRREAG